VSCSEGPDVVDATGFEEGTSMDAFIGLEVGFVMGKTK